MKISRFKSAVRAMREIVRIHASPSLDDVQLYLGERLVFASYESGRTQILKLTPNERVTLSEMLRPVG